MTSRGVTPSTTSQHGLMRSNRMATQTWSSFSLAIRAISIAKDKYRLKRVHDLLKKMDSSSWRLLPKLRQMLRRLSLKLQNKFMTTSQMEFMTCPMKNLESESVMMPWRLSQAKRQSDQEALRLGNQSPSSLKVAAVDNH